jgi:Beta-lactamase
MRADLAARVGAVLGQSSARHIGIVVGVRADGESAVWHRGRLPDGARSILEIGSITKVFTTTLLADLAREGLVSLDDPVQQHLPPGVRMPRHGREITLEDLATHRSGLPRLPRGLLVPALTRERRDPYAKLDAARLQAAIASSRPRREPGRRPVYSNYGMGLLGYLLAQRARTTYERSSVRASASRSAWSTPGSRRPQPSELASPRATHGGAGRHPTGTSPRSRAQAGCAPPLSTCSASCASTPRAPTRRSRGPRARLSAYVRRGEGWESGSAG